jgi:hypothetical protein
MFVWCDVIPTMCQWRLLHCKPYMSPMITWFGPLERHLKNAFFFFFGKGPTFLVIVVLQNFMLLRLYSTIHHTQLIIQHVMIVSNIQEIM